MSLAPDTRAQPPAGARVSRRYKWWVVFMLWFICFFNYADRQAISSVFPKLREEFGFDTVQLSHIGAAFMWVYAFGAPVAGFIHSTTRGPTMPERSTVNFPAVGS